MAIRSSPSGRSIAIESDILFGTALALGQFAPNLRSLVVIGRNPDVGVTEEDIWEGGGLYPFLTSAAALEILSSSASDSSLGTGARSARVVGLDHDGYEVTVDVPLNGTTPVSLGTFLRINSGLVLTSGSNGSNVGTLTARTVIGATTQLVIGAGRGYQSQFIFTVPRGHSAVIGSFFFSTELASGAISGGNATLITALSRAEGSNTWLRLAGFSANDFVATSELNPLPPASVLPELSDFRFSASCLTAAMRVNAGATITLAKNDVNFTV